MTPAEIAAALCALSVEMHAIGMEMDYCGETDEMCVHGRELVGAACIALEWAAEIEMDARV